jgi:hypothetical protein
MAQIVEYKSVAANPAVDVGMVEASGLAVSNVTTSGTAANTSLADATRFITIKSETKAVRYDIGNGVTATANSLLLEANSERSHGIPPARNNTWRVSIIDD